MAGESDITCSEVNSKRSCDGCDELIRSGGGVLEPPEVSWAFDVKGDWLGRNNFRSNLEALASNSGNVSAFNGFLLDAGEDLSWDSAGCSTSASSEWELSERSLGECCSTDDA